MSTWQERDGVRTIFLYTTDNGATWIPDPTGGLIALSPDGNAWRITVDNAGVVSAVPI